MLVVAADDECALVELFPPSSAYLSAIERIIAADSMPDVDRARP